MPEALTIERVQVLRRVTRAVSDLLREQLRGYLSTLSPLFRPRRVLGEHIRGAEKELTKGADRAFSEMQTLFDGVARAKPFTLARELKTPIDVQSVTLEIHPVEYVSDATAGGQTRRVTVRSPLTWILSYSGYGPGVLPDLLAHRTGANEELYDWLVHQVVLHAVVSNQPGLTDILARLNFPVSSVTDPSAGLLPLTRITSPLSTLRPSDEVIMQSVELSGMDAFEEVVNLQDIERMGNTLKDRLLEIAGAQGELSVRT